MFCSADAVVHQRGGEGIYTAQKIRFMQDRHRSFVAVFSAFHYLMYIMYDFIDRKKIFIL